MGAALIRPALVGVAVVAAILCGASADASEVDASTLSSLASRALTDPQALAQLRTVTSVGGRPVDLLRALDVTDPRVLEQRLRTLAADPVTATTPTAEAQQQAADILSQRKYQPPRPPRPFEAPIRWLARHVERGFNAVADLLPGGRSTVWTLLAVLVAAISAWGIRALISRRSRIFNAARQAEILGITDPDELEHRAAHAQADGHYELEIRLRFRAGLLRLKAAGLIDSADNRTSGQIARQLRDREFYRLAANFDAVVYGRRRAGPKRAAAARDGWQIVLDKLVGVHS